MACVNNVWGCGNHNPTKWHSLVDLNPDGSIACTGMHTHGDDPNAVNDLFGEPGAWFGNPGQSISYPWAPTEEQMVGNHWWYAWSVRRDLQPLFPDNGSTYFKDYRIQAHIPAAGGLGMQQQCRSFSWEAHICDQKGNCGLVRLGGLQDYGALMVNDAQAGDVCTIPNALAPAGQGSTTNRRIIAGLNSSRRDVTWYGANAANHDLPGVPNIRANVGLIQEGWGPYDTNDPANVSFWDPNQFNGSYLEAEVMAFIAPIALAVNGLVTASGFTDPYGNIQPPGACVTAGPNCIPFVLQGVPVDPKGTMAQYRDSVYNAQYKTTFGSADYDIKDPNGCTYYRFVS